MMRFIRRLYRHIHWRWLFGRAQKHRTQREARVVRQRWQRRIRWGVRVVLLLLALDAFYLIHIWPDWQRFEHGPIARSNFITQYEQQSRNDRSLPRLQWQPVKLNNISPHVLRAVIIGEDARFYYHSGFDVIALKEAMDYNLDKWKFKYGASTISQQTVKNMFFSASRDPLRKWHELIFTIGMEFKVNKKRILETYLNIAEFGVGIFGVEAAAQHYWQTSAKYLSPLQAAQLAACLPGPKRHNPKTNTVFYNKRVNKIMRFMALQMSATGHHTE